MSDVQPKRVRCRMGGHAPCIDDLCWHGFYPDTCPDCRDEEDYIE